MFGVAYLFFKIQNALTKGGIRPSAEVELGGVDIEMGVLAYPEFQGSSPNYVATNGATQAPAEAGVDS